MKGSSRSRDSEAEPRTVILVGGGHAHIQVLRSWAMDPPPHARLLVVLDQPVAVYSGMVPGFVAGDYALSELEIDVVPLARRAGAGVILARATDIDPVRQELSLEGRPPLQFDFASIDTGSTVRGLDLPGVREYALATRPISHFVRAIDAEAERLKHLAHAPQVVVVGGGAAGSEIALTLRSRLQDRGLQPRISLITSQKGILGGASSALQRKLTRASEQAQIEIIPHARVVSVSPNAVQIESAGANASANDSAHANDAAAEQTVSELPADLTVWATGAAPTAFPANQGATHLAQDKAGFIEVKSTLQTVGFDSIFAVGDCARLVDHPWIPKAGVYAVRQGPILDQNLRAALAGRKLNRYSPQRDFLSLLHLGRGRALGGKWGFALSGQGMLRLKDWIDRRFMDRFQILDPGGLPLPHNAALGAMETDEEASPMSCGGCAAKLGSLPLSEALASLPPAGPDKSVVLGLDARDDVAATRLGSDKTLLHNIDVIRAFCDDPYLIGRVATSNALSDLYAKGGHPRHAQAIIGLPELGPHAAREMLFQALSGVRETLDAAGVTLLGGHTTIGDDLTVGLAVTGDGPEAESLLRQSGTRPGDILLLTQPIGTGVVLAADMQGRLPGSALSATLDWMQRTNAEAGRIAQEQNVHASTDVTGFGLAGHLLTLLEAENLCAQLDRKKVPTLPDAQLLWDQGLRSTAHPQNRAAFIDRVSAADPSDEAWLFDPQTSGGLLLAVPQNRVGEIEQAFTEAGEPAPFAIGTVLADPVADKHSATRCGRIEVST